MVTKPDFKIMYARPVLYAVLLSTHIVIQYIHAGQTLSRICTEKQKFVWIFDQQIMINNICIKFWIPHIFSSCIHVSPSNTILSPCTHFVFCTLLWRFKKCRQKTKTKPSNVSVLTLCEQFASLRLNTIVYFLF